MYFGMSCSGATSLLLLVDVSFRGSNITLSRRLLVPFVLIYLVLLFSSHISGTKFSSRQLYLKLLNFFHALSCIKYPIWVEPPRYFSRLLKTIHQMCLPCQITTNSWLFRAAHKKYKLDQRLTLNLTLSLFLLYLLYLQYCRL